MPRLLIHRHRGQAPSHTEPVSDTQWMNTTDPLWEGACPRWRCVSCRIRTLIQLYREQAPSSIVVCVYSGDAVADFELRLVPGAVVEDVAEDFHGVPYLAETGVQRRKTKAHDARLAVVADHSTGNQRLDYRVAFRVFEAHMAAASGVFARGDQHQAVGGATGFDALDKQVGQGQGFTAQAGHVGLFKNLQAAFHHGQRGDRLGAAQVTGDAGTRRIARLHGE